MGHDNIKWIEENDERWAGSLSGMTEMFCDFAVMLIVIVRDCRRAQTGHCAGTAKVCLTELINQTAWASVSSRPRKPRRHSRVRDGKGRAAQSHLSSRYIH